MRLVLSLDSAAIEYLTSRDVDIEDLFVLICLHFNNWTLLNTYLKFKTEDQKIVFFQKLVRKLLVKVAHDQNAYIPEDYSLSSEGEIITNYLLEKCVVDNIEHIPENTKELLGIGNVLIMEKISQEKTPFDDFVEQFRAIFPEGQNGGNAVLKGHPLDVKKLLHKFMNKYRYDKQTIINATKLYIANFRGRYAYCHSAENFILKNNRSTLASQCELIMNNNEDKLQSINPFEQTM